jgi:hypothetical protein
VIAVHPSLKTGPGASAEADAAGEIEA